MSFDGLTLPDINKNNYDSMRKQVFSLPNMLDDIFYGYVKKVECLLGDINASKIERVYIFGCGDSCFVGQVVKYLFESVSRIPVEVYTSLEFSRYVIDSLPDENEVNALAIGISVSGSVSRTREALMKAKEKGLTTLALTTKTGPFTEMANHFIIADSPPFADDEPNGTPGVRSFFCNYLMLSIIAVLSAERRKTITSQECKVKLDQFLSLALVIKTAIELVKDDLDLLCSAWADTHEYVFVGSGPNLGAAHFCAAKLIESVGDFSIAQETEEWAHLNFYNRKKDTPTVILSSGKNESSRTSEIVSAALDIGRRVLLITPESAVKETERCNVLVYPDGYDEWISALFPCIFLSLYASSRAVLLNETYFRINNRLETSKIRTSEIVE